MSMNAALATPRVNYRGVSVDEDLAGMIRHMPAVDSTREALQGLQGVWDSLSLLSEMSGTGVEVASIRAAFASLTSVLVNETGRQALHAAVREQKAKAQVIIDILVRNLFERTADIGFLSMDEDLRAFAAARRDQRDASRAAIHQRLAAYAKKYTVYDDIVLLSPEGEVLARLDSQVGVERTTDRALLAEALTTKAAYVEVCRPFDLCPSRPRTLVYACRVMDSHGSCAVGVLCLAFRFENEAELIFRKFVDVNDWSVVAILDADGVAMASSDPFQVPVGARVGVPIDGGVQPMRFSGRTWLAVSCPARPFQGYDGPGWRGHSMTPLEHAFGDEEAGRTPVLDLETADRLQESRVLYPERLRDIARAAQRIEGDLARAVWNGNLALIAATVAESAARKETADLGTPGAGFSRSLLREIGRTGVSTREGFTHALSQMSGAVARATLADVQSCAALAIDVMDRSLYERANDCRWWASTTAFRSALETGEAVDAADAAALGSILESIHGLYTVYSNLLLFDREGRVVASSIPTGAAAVGRRLEDEWVQRALRLATPQDYCVSDFEASALYDGRPTYVFAAAVRGLECSSKVVGGVAIVFDSEAQFRSMLRDTLPQDESGAAVAGAFGVFVDAAGLVISCSDASLAPGSPVSVRPAGGVSIQVWRGNWYAVGAKSSTGYREFKGDDDPYEARVQALVFSSLVNGEAGSSGSASTLARPSQPAAPRRSPTGAAPAAGKRLELATVRIGHQWYALPGAELVEAVRPDKMVPLPGREAYIRGCLLYRDMPIAIVDPRAMLGEQGDVSPSAQVVVVEPAGGRVPRFGLLVDALGDNPVVSVDQIVRLAEGSWHRGASGAVLIDRVVAAEPGVADRSLLTMLSVAGLAALLGFDASHESTASVK